MRANAILFWILAIFFAMSDAAYIIWSFIYYHGSLEPVGAVALTFSVFLAIFLAFFFGRTTKSFGGLLPEDRLDANIDDADPELGHFSPWSWWPIILAGGVGFGALGLAVGVWIAFIGGAITAIALVGWVYEYYRGNFAR